MSVRVYIVPVVADVVGFTAKYFNDLGVSWTGQLYGLEPVMLVAADVTGPQHTSIAANGDVAAFPLNLDAVIGANLATVQAQLESRDMPSDWVDASMTYRQLLKWLTRLFALVQRITGMYDLDPFANVTLDTVIGPLWASRLEDVAASFGQTVTVPPGATIRQVFKAVADLVPSTPAIRGLVL